MRLAVIVALVACLTGCASVAPVQHINPPVTLVTSPFEAWGQASDAAVIEDGEVYMMLPTGSMEPFLTAGDYMVIVPAVFASYRDGEIMLYDAEWVPPGEPDVIHRIVGRDRFGLIMQGDANPPRSEERYRVTDETDKGRLIGVWRVGL